MSLVGYATEIIANVPKFKAALPAGAADPEIEAFLYKATNLTMTAPGVFGGAIFDMARG